MAIESGFNPIFLKNQGKARGLNSKAREFSLFLSQGEGQKKG
jgi:hypothetical protein